MKEWYVLILIVVTLSVQGCKSGSGSLGSLFSGPVICDNSPKKECCDNEPYAVPEPATITLFALGGAGLLLKRKLKKG